MALQIKMTNRRQFLERSMLGFGSAFLLPSLLASCTDHLIDPTKPSQPTKPPLLGDDEGIDWNDAAKNTVSTFLQLVPDVGGFLGSLTSIFWPSSGDDVWSQVKSQVEALVNQKITEQVYSNVQDALGSLTPTPTGLVSYINTYQNELKYGKPSDILGAWKDAVGAFTGAQQYFQDSNNQVPLLPLFAQFANMYLSLLRDGVISGQSWGRSDAEHNNIDVPALAKAISAFTTYAKTTYQTSHNNVLNNTKPDRSNVEPFRSTNAYDRMMTMTVLDYMDSWKYYDVSVYPNGAVNLDGTKINLFTREIYSDPYGNIVNGTIPPPPGIVLPSPATQFPTQLTVWGGIELMRFSSPTLSLTEPLELVADPGGLPKPDVWATVMGVLISVLMASC